ncbi:MAG: hypothetical protein CFE39_12635 [Comamonadaceae bacterium PBBC2]|nr:MAG: hypothetical protein CFE39_12635 [Comamonadaceae bacterium PBBC2]
MANGTGNVLVGNGGLTTATNKTLAVTLDNVTGGWIKDSNIYTTLNVTTANTASTLADIQDTVLETLAIAGTKGLTLTTAAGMTTLKTVTVSGSAGLTSSDLTTASITSIDASATSGANTITFNAVTSTYKGGTGVDKVTTSAAAPTKAIDLGTGDDTLTLASGTTAVTGTIVGGDGSDTLVMVAADAVTASGTTTFAGKVTGFEKLSLTGVANNAVDAGKLGNYNDITVAGNANTLALSGLTSGAKLTLTTDTTAITLAGAFTGTTDVANLVLTASNAVRAAGSITAAAVETINITNTNTATTPTAQLNTMTLVGANATSVIVSGNAGLNLTGGTIGTALTNVDASGVTLGGFSFTSGALAAASTIKGSAAGTNAINFTAALGAVTYTGGTGTDTVTFTAGNTLNNSIALGAGDGIVASATQTWASGNNTVTLASSGAVAVANGATGSAVTLGAGNNSVTDTGTKGAYVSVLDGANTITTGAGADFITVGTGGNTISTGAGNDTITIGASKALNTVNVGTGTDTVIFGGVPTAGGYYTSITGMSAGDVINMSAIGAGAASVAGALGAKITLGAVSSFANYLDAAAAGTATSATNAIFKWFQFTDGNTYIVVDSSNNATFADGVDSVIQLVGLVDLSTSTLTAAQVLTLV